MQEKQVGKDLEGWDPEVDPAFESFPGAGEWAHARAQYDDDDDDDDGQQYEARHNKRVRSLIPQNLRRTYFHHTAQNPILRRLDDQHVPRT